MKRARLIVPAVALLLLATAGLWWWRAARDGDDGLIAASGTVEATEADLGFQAGGRIAEVAVREGDAVRAGDVLARLDVAELQARRTAALAQLASARALLDELRHGARPEELAQAAAAADAARERLAEAERGYGRTRRLHEGGAVSREALDQAQTAFQVAQAQYRQAREQAALVREGPRAERLEAQRAAVRQAEAAVAQADAALANAVIVAPFAGVVSVRHREPGETVAPGLPVLSLLDPADRWVRIFVREDQIGRVAVGQSAVISADSYRERRYPGRVTFIAREAEFTPRNVQTDAERVKLVYAVKVAVRGDSALDLRPGVPADVRLRPKGAAPAPPPARASR